MRHASLQEFLDTHRPALATGTVAIILAEDPVEVDSTLYHHLQAGFGTVILLAAEGITITPELQDRVHRITHPVREPDALVRAVNRIQAACPPLTWIYYGYNAEYLFHPFRESRNLPELVAFHTEERRDAMLCYVVDLYAGDLGQYPNAVDLEGALLDGTGYYALARRGADGHPKERQLDFFGGIRWRFEEHVPPARRRIDRIALFRSRPGLELGPDYLFSIEEYNTYACPWHHNLTAAIASFRTAKALKSNPGSTYDIPTFQWHNSVPFRWHSQQLMDLGLMEPGQWF